MDKMRNTILKVLNANIKADTEGYITGREDSSEELTNLFTPKLQWKSEEIRHHGGDILLATVHLVTNYHTSIQVYDPVNGTAGVNWNGNLVFEGTLEECKKFCSDKILNDFLTLCE